MLVIVVSGRNDDPDKVTPVRTKIDDIKHFCALVLGDAREQLPIRTRRDTDDGHHVRAVVLDELDARVLFLP